MKLVHLLSSFFALAECAFADTTNVVDLAARLWSVDLTLRLSRDSLISVEAPPRWSSFKAPHPAVVVNVGNELDVALTVQYCTLKGIPFLAQNGGNGWATTFDLGQNGILINLARLNQVIFNADKTRATIGGGSSINNTISKAYAAEALIGTGNCNCVGTLGAMLGGGFGNLMGLYGFGVDNIVSLRVVTADGVLRDVTPTSDPDLFWGLRGAGPNLGIVTSAVVKSYPASQSDMQAWTGPLIFTPDKLEAIVQAIQDIHLRPEMNVFMYFISGGPPKNEPVIIVVPFLHKGGPESGRSAFASLYALKPVADSTTVIPYIKWNSAGDMFCERGARKPSYSAGFQKLVPTVWRQIWDKYVEFQKKPTAQSSAVLLEAYSMAKARSVDAHSASFPHRNVNFNALAIAWYSDKALDGSAQAFGRAVRDLWRGTDELPRNSTYVNFAHGDEALQVVYGDNLPRLQSVKAKYDPNNAFNQWFDITQK